MHKLRHDEVCKGNMQARIAGDGVKDMCHSHTGYVLLNVTPYFHSVGQNDVKVGSAISSSSLHSCTEVYTL